MTARGLVRNSARREGHAQQHSRAHKRARVLQLRRGWSRVCNVASVRAYSTPRWCVPCARAVDTHRAESVVQVCGVPVASRPRSDIPSEFGVASYVLLPAWFGCTRARNLWCVCHLCLCTASTRSLGKAQYDSIVVPVVQLYHTRGYERTTRPVCVRLHGAVVKKIAQKHSPQRLFFPGQRTAPASLAWRGTAWIGYPG